MMDMTIASDREFKLLPEEIAESKQKKERTILQPGYSTLLKQYNIPDDHKARMRLLANLIIDRYLKDKAEGRLKTFD